MQDNIGRVMDRGDRLEDLRDKSGKLDYLLIFDPHFHSRMRMHQFTVMLFPDKVNPHNLNVI